MLIYFKTITFWTSLIHKGENIIDSDLQYLNFINYREMGFSRKNPEPPVEDIDGGIVGIPVKLGSENARVNLKKFNILNNLISGKTEQPFRFFSTLKAIF